VTTQLGADEARRAALWAQGFVGAPYPVTPGTGFRRPSHRRVAAVRSVLEHLGAVQLDTISVLARSHELVAYARLGPVGRECVEAAYWGTGDHPAAESFEYWSHAACILPIDEWPWFSFRRREYRRRGIRWHEVPTGAVDDVRARLRDEGAMTAADLGGAKRGGVWWDWSDTKIAVEWLLDVGEVACVRRVGWRRVYDLAERAVDPALREGPGFVDTDGVHGPSDDECLRRLVGLGGRALGVGTAADIADVHRLPVDAVRRHAADAGLVPVAVTGWRGPVWASQPALAWLAADGRGRRRTTLLSPFDSLVWHRGRTARLFGIEHRLEAYTPAAKRVHGYFAMPVLHAGRIVARVDPVRERRSRADGGGCTLVARRVTLETRRDGSPVTGAVAGTAAALREAATWVGCEAVRVDSCVPGTAAQALASALAQVR
jgi:uncharacterized protein YcaQ